MTTLPPELEEIAELLRMDEPRVVVVVGAGVSVAATGLPQASWPGLLRHGIQYRYSKGEITEKRHGEFLESIKEAFSPFDLNRALELAESIERELQIPNDAAYAEWLRNAFEDFKATDSAALLEIRDLQQAGALVLTTNFDSLLEDCTGLPPVTWQDHREFFEVSDRQRVGILHIHGHWQHPSSVALGRSSYERLGDAHELQDVFKSLWLHWTWVYLGCGDGLADQNLGRLLRWGSEKFGASARRDFYLGKQDSVERLMGRPDCPANLRGVGFPEHEHLPVLLHHRFGRR